MTATPRRRPRPATRATTSPPLTPLIDSWTLSLQSANKSPKTIRGYIDSAHAFAGWLGEHGHPTDADGVQAEHVRAFIVAELARTSPASADCHFRYLRVFFNWLIREGDRTLPTPVDPADRPKVPTKVKPYLTDEEVARLLKTCSGADFESRRDRAILMILIDNGARARGLGDIRVDGVDLKGRCVTIVLKGGKQMLAPIGAKAAQAIDRYLRIRAAHARADSPWLWLGVTGRDVSHFTHWGIRQMLERRSEEAGLAGKANPHRFRAKATHDLLAARADAGDVQRILGWATRDMVYRYGEALADERARETHARLSPADRF